MDTRKKYRDIGQVNGSKPTDELVDFSHKRTQVQLATHNGAGDRTPLFSRSFISFTYGGIPIEDFNLIAITESDAISRTPYAPFADTVSDSDVFCGQIYQHTHFSANSIKLVLATDEITDPQLEQFKRQFAPGQIRELVLAEHPNRGILARVSDVPEYTLLPFEHHITTKIGGIEVPTNTTCYRGKIGLTLIMDDPFQYALKPIIDDQKDDGSYRYNHYTDINGKDTLICDTHTAIEKITDPATNKEITIDIPVTDSNIEASKVILEDGVPSAKMIKSEAASGYTILDDEILFGTENHLVSTTDENDAKQKIGGAAANDGYIAYEDTPAKRNQIGIADNVPFYYAGTAFCQPTVSFSIKPTLNSDGYINTPQNEAADDIEYGYNTMTSFCTTDSNLDFSTPSIQTAYNQVIKILHDCDTGIAWEDLRLLLRDNVKHWAPRAYAIALIDEIPSLMNEMMADEADGNELVSDITPLDEQTTTSVTYPSDDKTDDVLSETADQLAAQQVVTRGALDVMIQKMTDFLRGKDGDFAMAHFIMNGHDGNAIGEFTFTNAEGDVQELTEQVGDMIKNHYLRIIEQNHPDTEGNIVEQTEEHPTTSHIFYHDVPNGIYDFQIQYKYLYL